MVDAPILHLSSALADNGEKVGRGYSLDSGTLSESKKVNIITSLVPSGKLEYDLNAPCGYQQYSLRAILNLWELREDSYSEYLKKMTSAGEESVTFIDRRLILDFLNGATKTLHGVKTTSADSDIPAKTLLFHPPSTKDRISPKQGPRQEPAMELKDLEISLKISSGQINLGDYRAALFIPETNTKNFGQILEISQKLLISGKKRDFKDPEHFKSDNRHSLPRAASLKESRSHRIMQNDSNLQETCATPHPSQKIESHIPKRHFKYSDSTPIIIVPSGVQPMINLLNVKSFLSDGLYVPITEIQDIYQQRPEYVMIERQIKASHGSGLRTTVKRYKIVDSADNLRPSDWDKVIAAFVTGQTWQFSKWKWNEPAELFGKIRGFCVKYVDDPPPGLVGKWSVVQLLIHRTWRHNDLSAANIFWKEVDNFLSQNAASRPI